MRTRRPLLAGNLLVLMLASSPARPQESRDARPEAENLQTDKPQRGNRASESVHRLEFVTWDPAKCELVWEVTTGTKKGDQYTPSQRVTYRIEMDAAVMRVGAERRGFEEDEATKVHLLMDMISRYAAESTIWWENGSGSKIDSPSERPTARRPSPNTGTTTGPVSSSAGLLTPAGSLRAPAIAPKATAPK